MFAIAAAAFVADLLFRVPFPAIVAASAGRGIGAALGRGPDRARRRALDDPARAVPVHVAPSAAPRRGGARGSRSWWCPLVLLGWCSAGDDVFYAEAVFFSKSRVVTFGGAYAVLAYIAQRASADSAG